MALTDEVATYEQLMEHVMTAYKARMMRVCKGAELTPPQFFALYAISRLDRTKMSPLADELGLSMGAASTLVDRLVTRGLVERDTDPSDRRAVFVCLNVKGQAVLAEAKAARREIWTHVFEHVEPGVRRQLLVGLEGLAVAMDRLPPVTGDHGCTDE